MENKNSTGFEIIITVRAGLSCPILVSLNLESGQHDGLNKLKEAKEPSLCLFPVFIPCVYSNK